MGWRLTERLEAGGQAAGRCSGPPIYGEADANFLLTLIERQSDLTLDEVVRVLRKQGIAESRTSVWRFFSGTTSRSKKPCARPEAARADVARARWRWMLSQHRTCF